MKKFEVKSVDFLTSTTHLHMTICVIMLVLFFLAATGIVKSKGVHHALRLFYILIIVSGGALYEPSIGDYHVKATVGLLTIAMMEMVLVKKSKGKPNTIFWVLFAIFLFVTMFYGFKLPMGWNFLM